MRYRVTCLTPTLVGDGAKLAPIDYMVWRDQVNVLDQNRIFRLLSRGPRLDNYLAQIRKAERLDFATWGGFAQNFAGRRISFEHSSCAQAWERARPDDLFIPTFVSASQGPYLPGSSLKGALRTSLVLARSNDRQQEEFVSRCAADGPPRRPGEALEHAVLGSSSSHRTRALLVSDSEPAPAAPTRVYLLRVATLAARQERVELAWKASPRGSVEPRRVADSIPLFAEMTVPGAEFFGAWMDRAAFRNQEMLSALRWREGLSSERLLEAVNQASALLLDGQTRWAEQAGLASVSTTVRKLRQRLDEIRSTGRSALLSIGWATGLTGKLGLADPGSAQSRRLLEAVRVFSSQVRTGLPFPKTRRIVFLQGQPATLPGWVQLDLFDQ
jgi:CRISPR-associated protein Csm5